MGRERRKKVERRKMRLGGEILGFFVMEGPLKGDNCWMKCRGVEIPKVSIGVVS